VGEEERGLLPDDGEEFVQVVGGRRAGAGADAEGGGDVVEQPELRVVQQLALLLLQDQLHGQAQLFLVLVQRHVVEVRDTGVHPQHGLRHGEFMFARLRVVVHEGLGQLRLTVVPRGDGRCPRVVGLPACPELREGAGEFGMLVLQLP
jgi:hypothetical protein